MDDSIACGFEKGVSRDRAAPRKCADEHLGFTHSHMALECGDVEAIRSLIDCGADPDMHRETPLHLVSAFGGLEAASVELLRRRVSLKADGRLEGSKN
jgi:hypothetical protein